MLAYKTALAQSINSIATKSLKLFSSFCLSTASAYLQHGYCVSSCFVSLCLTTLNFLGFLESFAPRKRKKSSLLIYA